MTRVLDGSRLAARALTALRDYPVTDDSPLLAGARDGLAEALGVGPDIRAAREHMISPMPEDVRMILSATRDHAG